MARAKAFDEERVIEQAMHLFRQQGYEATSIRDLVAHLGISSSSLYGTYGDKDAIFMLALERHGQIEQQLIRQQLSERTDPRATLERLFATMIDQLLKEELPYGSLTLKAAIEVGVNKPRVTEYLRGYLDEIRRVFTAFLAEAAADGKLRLPEPAPDVALYLLFALFNLSFLARIYRDRSQLENYTRVVLRVLDGEAPAVP